ncbi:MAG: B12-binding domain-containing radical SAM protein, partial [Myxococcales bacterium]|nr:B12-binding domain-containing radical SAM protein [Myxococcales bacterium]
LRYAPLTLPHLAALVPQDMKADIQIIDEGIDEIDTNLDVDLVGMTVITGCANRTYELAAKFRDRGVPVVLGGPHVTLIPEDAQPHADAICVGYAEESWPQLLRDLAAGRMKSRYDMREDLPLTGLPLPRYDLVKASHYTTTAVFEATRGCIHTCDFCVVPSAWGTVPFKRPIEEVTEEIRRRGAKKLIFLDLNIIADRDHAMKLFEALVPLKLQWFGLATSLIGKDDELLDMTARSGCKGLLVGLESTNTKSLRFTHKGFNKPDDYMVLVSKLHAKGIAIQGTFASGLDHDTTETIMETARFAVDAGVDLPRFAIVTPFPGTALYKKIDAEGRILTRNWDLYDGQHVVFQPKLMSVQELQDANERAWRHVYSFPSIVRRLAKARVQLPLSIAANLGYRFYAKNLKTHYNCDSLISYGARKAA